MSTVLSPATTLRVFDETHPEAALHETQDGTEIARLLREVGIRFERWSAERALDASADEAAVLGAYSTSIERLQREGGYGSVDVLRLKRGTPDVAPIRAKFLDEHAHSEDEVRFFVEGRGAFYLRTGGRVYQVVCVRGDLISVPAGMRHWFDMGSDPEFTAIRFFTNKEGWVPEYTGEDIAKKFPLLDE